MHKCSSKYSDYNHSHADKSYRKLRLFIAFFLLLFLYSCGKIELYNGLQEQETNEMIAILLEAGIDSQKTTEKDTHGILVKSSQVKTAILLLKNNGYPREHFEGVGEVFQQQGMITSNFEQQVRFNYALTQDLADTLSKIDGVRSARVHVAVPERNSINEQITNTAAAAFIKYDETYDLESLVPQIKNLLANSITNIKYNDISVVLIPTARENIDKQKKPSYQYYYIGASVLLLLIIASALLWFFKIRS